MDLNGRRVLITGASRGIGEATARRFADAGATVALVARNADALEQLATELSGTAHPADLTDPDTVDALIGRVEDESGPVDVLVNNAGVDSVGAFVEMDPGDLQRIYQLNLVAPVQLTRQVLPGMLERGRGRIVNVSSLAGVAAYPGMVSYASTKAGLSQFTEVLALDLQGLPVGTTLVELGPIPTDMLDNVESYAPTGRLVRPRAAARSHHRHPPGAGGRGDRPGGRARPSPRPAPQAGTGLPLDGPAPEGDRASHHHRHPPPTLTQGRTVGVRRAARRACARAGRPAWWPRPGGPSRWRGGCRPGR